MAVVLAFPQVMVEPANCGGYSGKSTSPVDSDGNLVCGGAGGNGTSDAGGTGGVGADHAVGGGGGGTGGNGGRF